MSFSTDTKSEAAAFQMKKPCCRRAFIYGVLLFGAETGGDEISLYVDGIDSAEICAKMIKEQFGRDVVPAKIGARSVLLLAFDSKPASAFLQSARAEINSEKLFHCPECQTAFLRGVFVGGGTVNTPQAHYHMELKSRTLSDLSAISEMLTENGFSFKSSERLGKPTLYVKESGMIEDFLFYIGANKQAFELMNAKINHEIKNDINRRTNCETSNIARSTAAAAKHLSSIRFLKERGRLSELGPELEYTAKMRLENPEISLLQLGQIMTPQVSKSGLFHRLEKICAFAETIKNKGI